MAAVNDANPEQRPGLREYALELLREGTEGTDQSAARRASAPAAAAGSNPIGIALLLGIVALPALLLFTPVGLVLLVIALVLGVWGVVTTLRRP